MKTKNREHRRCAIATGSALSARQVAGQIRSLLNAHSYRKISDLEFAGIELMLTRWKDQISGDALQNGGDVARPGSNLNTKE